MFQRPKQPPVTAPQPSVSGSSSALSRPKNPPATAPRNRVEGVLTRPKNLPASAPMRAEVYSGSDSLGITIAEGLEILWTFFTELPLADYERAARAYQDCRLYPKYSTLGEDASEADRRRENHEQALLIAIREVKEPSQKYLVSGPAVPSVAASYVPVYSFSVSSPMPTIERPVAPPLFKKKAPLWQQEVELGLEIDWNNARNDAAALMRLQKKFVELYQPYYRPQDVRPQLFSAVAEPADVEMSVNKGASCAPAFVPPSAATTRVQSRLDVTADSCSPPLELSSALVPPDLNHSQEEYCLGGILACSSPEGSVEGRLRSSVDGRSLWGGFAKSDSSVGPEGEFEP